MTTDVIGDENSDLDFRFNRLGLAIRNNGQNDTFREEKKMTWTSHQTSVIYVRPLGGTKWQI